jgi:hypothetical protein
VMGAVMGASMRAPALRLHTPHFLSSVYMPCISKKTALLAHTWW